MPIYSIAVSEEKHILGQSVKGEDLLAWPVTQGGSAKALLMSGVHGNEPEGVYLVERLIQEKLYKLFDGKGELWVFPRANPDGLAMEQRCNANNVDLNRNMPTNDWNPEAFTDRYQPGFHAGSEPECVALVRFLKELQPKFIITIHSISPEVGNVMLNYNGQCRLLAAHMSEFNHLPVEGSIGYPTPGCLGTWAGFENNMPTITMEVLRGESEDELWKKHSLSLVEGIEFGFSNEGI